MLNETTLEGWYVVTFFDTPESQRVLWGIVKEDFSCRWYPGDWCCTSPVLQVIDSCAYITKNTRYTIFGPGKHIKLPVKALIELRQGVNPTEWSSTHAKWDDYF